MLSVLEVIAKTSEFFAGKGVESPRLNAELIVGHALGLKRMHLYVQFERLVSESELGVIRGLVRRRGRREPLQYVLGEAEFCGLKLRVDARALIPRPETELLAEVITGRIVPPPARILDLGTGSGALALGLAKGFPEAAVTAVDRSSRALALARENAEATGLAGRVTFLESDWFSALPPEARFELIAANPPYLTPIEVASAAPEVRDFEPMEALAGGDDGLSDLNRILAGAPRYLAEGGWLALETGIDHPARLVERARAAGFSSAEAIRDLTGRDRFVLARL